MKNIPIISDAQHPGYKRSNVLRGVSDFRDSLPLGSEWFYRVIKNMLTGIKTRTMYSFITLQEQQTRKNKKKTTKTWIATCIQKVTFQELFFQYRPDTASCSQQHFIYWITGIIIHPPVIPYTDIPYQKKRFLNLPTFFARKS
ncbi:hypothetical protein GDO78_020009 [Eleutherodactylus coqui]|uniref:Uncharacterized protein n=1 Tax=Eleutherodactylus coqui TaxID=57060 RepID=A0A8J6EN06_ELECQ|nr:hypothetical protein GDO78_020009 [Eleutherodactylus coqui]